MELTQIRNLISSQPIETSVEYFLNRDSVAIFEDKLLYDEYRGIVKRDHPNADKILIGGSGNWGYSFNPYKLFREFSSKSDVDLVIVSDYYFRETWDSIREYHRGNWYRIGTDNQMYLRRNGENIYSGFASLKWIPDNHSKSRIKYEEMANSYSNELVGYRTVNVMYFKNIAELYDYYKRSFLIVRRS